MAGPKYFKMTHITALLLPVKVEKVVSEICV
jgi:hypothetical protein